MSMMTSMDLESSIKEPKTDFSASMFCGGIFAIKFFDSLDIFYIHFFLLKKVKAVKAPASIRNRTIQKSPGTPTMGSHLVFILKRVAKNIAGKGTKAIPARVFI